MTRIIALIILLGFFKPSFADTLLLKNGRSIEGIIKSEDNEMLELEVGGGVVKFKKSEIEKVTKGYPEETKDLRNKWEKQRKETEKKILMQEKEEESRPRQVEFSADRQSIRLRVTLNKKADVSLLLDTGASIVMLRRHVAKKLGMNLDRIKPDMKVTVADGRQVNAKYVVLDSVKVQGVEARNVEASILLDELGDANMGDGLLGMSFLKRFNFKIDHKENKLILEKL